MKNQELVNFLKECGVCRICQLRYLKARGTEYQHLKSTFKQLEVEYESSEEYDAEQDTVDLDDDSKKRRINICPCCLGLFSNTFQRRLIEGILASDIENFECGSIVIAISMPILLQIRQLSMWFALKNKFGNVIDTDRSPDVPLKEAAKLILNPIICEKLGKSYDVNDGLMINIQLTHPDESKEVESLKKLNDQLFPMGKGKNQPISRGLIEKKYLPNRISDEKYREYIIIPPSMTTTTLDLNVNLTGPTVCVAGRYRKITRELSHTPWILNGIRMMEESIEEIIMNSIVPYFGCDRNKVIFMSSGREDVDVRCLGKGRPFVLEMPNSKKTTLPRDIAENMQLEIDKSLKVSVRDLQIVEREELVHIKAGEEHKRKYYRAMCQLQEPVTLEILKKLDLPKGFETQQKTPIRVLHRRPLHTRPRMIYSLKAFVHRENPRLLVLDIVSQAGTYIKELVHGEFGRTTPSISSLIGRNIDILALDVVAIDLDWPKEINSDL